MPELCTPVSFVMGAVCPLNGCILHALFATVGMDMLPCEDTEAASQEK